MIAAIILGSIIVGCAIRSGKRRRSRKKTVTHKTTRTVITTQRPVDPMKARRDAERLAMDRLRRDQARDDLIHHEQQMRDLMKLYAAAEQQYETASTEARREAAFRKMYSIDRQMRSVEKQRERAKTIASI